MKNIALAIAAIMLLGGLMSAMTTSAATSLELGKVAKNLLGNNQLSRPITTSATATGIAQRNSNYVSYMFCSASAEGKAIFNYALSCSAGIGSSDDSYKSYDGPGPQIITATANGGSFYHPDTFIGSIASADAVNKDLTIDQAHASATVVVPGNEDVDAAAIIAMINPLLERFALMQPGFDDDTPIFDKLGLDRFETYQNPDDGTVNLWYRSKDNGQTWELIQKTQI
ncbi:MAG: hypothetical protein PHH26_01370 [Candidatus Thermoplasmatota archaeon]|nr:hypothetical protein [Candidatus Thermoplasmatota archaeon]